LYPLLKQILFLLEAEKAHHLTISVLRQLQQYRFFTSCFRNIYSFQHPSLRKKIMGLEFPNPLGLAAGLDKNAEVFPVLGAMGFGFVEIGTLTPRPQEGNPRPRLFRLPRAHALLNRMGFNNVGADQAACILEKNLKICKPVLGINIGKNKITPNKEAVQDYLYCLQVLHPFADYFVINVSSPNTPGLRNLLEKEPLLHLLTEVQNKNLVLSKKPCPVLLKISPDMSEKDLDTIAEVAVTTGINGIIATNTTISRDCLFPYSSEEIQQLGEGGISGRPLKEKSRNIVKYLRERVPKEMVIIGCGGIMDGEDALSMLQSGADLIQVYTGFIFKGPSIIKTILRKLAHEKLHAG
jgi:dihydroorotate dehydrogenase